MSVKSLSFVLMLMAMSHSAMAQLSNIPLEKRFSAEQMHATGLDTLSAKQLALLNQLLQEQPKPSPAIASQNSSVPANPATPVNTSVPVVPVTQPVLSSEPFKSRIIGTFNGWQTGSVFTLENGQQWQVNKGSAKLAKPLNDPSVDVKISLVGKWYFEFNEELPRAMVVRIK